MFAGFVARIWEERLPQRVMFGEFVGGKSSSRGQEKDWLAHLKEEMSAFGIAKGCSEGWQMVRIVEETAVNAELA